MLADDAYCTPQKLWKMDDDWAEKPKGVGQKAISVNTMLITQIKMYCPVIQSRILQFKSLSLTSLAMAQSLTWRQSLITFKFLSQGCSFLVRHNVNEYKLQSWEITSFCTVSRIPCFASWKCGDHCGIIVCTCIYSKVMVFEKEEN